ncbi:HSF-type DNA-binding-domain-containing protein, partial [Ochromonadaceae sp. CCMP2298]
WSEKGDTVIIKDVKQFAEKIIPTAYKHNNFSSFVRQLNFYGFRKIKSESMEHSEWWEFRHPQFLRDAPQLLSEIKRSVHFCTSLFYSHKC